MSITVSFYDLSTPGPSGPVTAWSWNFGDGATSASANPTHDYATPGAYRVSLQITGTSPDSTASVTKTVTVT